MGISLARALRLEPHLPAEGAAVAFVGSGGKTTAMFQLAREVLAPVLVTTTTHLGASQTFMADRHIIATRRGDLSQFAPHGVSLITGPAASEGRFGSVDREVLLWLRDISQQQHIPLLIEADGSRQKPLKAPAAHEPDIPDFVEMVIVVAGLAGLGQPLAEENVHRPEIFAEMSGLALGDPLTPEAVVRVLTDPDGGLRKIPPYARKVVILNQDDNSAVESQALGMVSSLLGAYEAAIIASLRNGEIHAVHEPAAGIVLAAGTSKRLGRSKQLLDWHGQPFVRAVAGTALAAGLSPVMIVTGSNAQEVEAALAGMPVEIVRNADWESGQASSIRCGLKALPGSTGSAVFLLADQPQATQDVIRALVDTHAAGLFPIVAPLVKEERRANPVLFDRDSFADLMALDGDVGGRAIFSKHRVTYLPWHDERLLLDVDTEADYRRLMEDDKP